MHQSKQRSAIKSFLMTRTDHPTAENIYLHLKPEYPNLSLGTVYRNLAVLSDNGEIWKLHFDDGIDRYDGNVMPHNHFLCTGCKAVSDLELPYQSDVDDQASKYFNGKITGHVIYYYGLCEKCTKEQ